MPIDAIVSLILILSAIFIPFLLYVPWKEYFFAKSSGIQIDMKTLVFMKIRRIELMPIINAAAIFQKAGINIDLIDIESQYLAGGHVENLAKAFAVAKKANIDTNFKQLAAIDLCGRDVLQSVKECLEPIVFNSDYVSFKSRDGKEYRVSINLTLQKNINKIIGGAENQALIDKIFDYIGVTISKNTSESVNPRLLEEEILKEDFSKNFSSYIKSIKINI